MRWRLAVLVAATTLLVLIAFLVPLAVLLRVVAAGQATNAANVDAQSLVTVVGTAADDEIRSAAERLGAQSKRPVSVFLADGRVLGTSVAQTAAVRLAARGQSLTADLNGDREIVIAVQGRADGTAVIRTVVSATELSRGVTRSWFMLFALGTVLVLLGMLVADRLARYLVRPIVDLSAVSRRLASAELTARAKPTGPPEVRDVAVALNDLADRIQDLLREEREHVADLSHRLRTPLTVLRLEADWLRDPDEATRVTGAVDALERAVTGLIRQARWRTATEAEGSSDAATIVAERVAFWSVLAEDTGRTVTVDLATGPLPVAVPAEDLAAAVDALLGNVFAHTPDGTPFAVTLVPDGSAVTLTIADAGPGVPAAMAGRGVSHGGSTGLGLDIARRAAQAGGGRLELRGGERGGAVVVLRLAPPRSSRDRDRSPRDESSLDTAPRGHRRRNR